MVFQSDFKMHFQMFKCIFLYIYIFLVILNHVSHEQTVRANDFKKHNHTVLKPFSVYRQTTDCDVTAQRQRSLNLNDCLVNPLS